MKHDDDDRDPIEEIFPTPRESLRLLSVYFAIVALIQGRSGSRPEQAPTQPLPHQ